MKTLSVSSPRLKKGIVIAALVVLFVLVSFVAFHTPSMHLYYVLSFVIGPQNAQVVAFGVAQLIADGLAWLVGVDWPVSLPWLAAAEAWYAEGGFWAVYNG